MEAIIQQILTNERNRYFDFFSQTIESLKSDNPICSTELAVQVNNEDLESPFNLIRLDFISKNKDGEQSIKDIRLDKNLEYDTIRFLVFEMAVELNPFCWNSCEITADQIQNDLLKDWVTKELKIDEEDDDNFSYSIHSCSSPILEQSEIKFTLDFGTSQPGTFVDFLHLLANSGTSKLLIETVDL